MANRDAASNAGSRADKTNASKNLPAGGKPRVSPQRERLRMPSTVLAMPRYLRGETIAPTPALTAAREEIRLAKRELELWETAFDRHGDGDPDEYHVEIRVAEERLRSARIREKRLIALR